MLEQTKIEMCIPSMTTTTYGKNERKQCNNVINLKNSPPKVHGNQSLRRVPQVGQFPQGNEASSPMFC